MPEFKTGLEDYPFLNDMCFQWKRYKGQDEKSAEELIEDFHKEILKQQQRNKE